MGDRRRPSAGNRTNGYRFLLSTACVATIREFADFSPGTGCCASAFHQRFMATSSAGHLAILGLLGRADFVAQTLA